MEASPVVSDPRKRKREQKPFAEDEDTRKLKKAKQEPMVCSMYVYMYVCMYV